MIKMTVEEALEIAIPQDIELTDLEEAKKKLGMGTKLIPITEQKLDTRTEKEKMDEVNAILKMTAEKKGCSVSDLQWRRDKYGAIHIKRKDAKNENHKI